MWVFTQDGFISAVDNGVVPGKLAVRARDKQSLELLSMITDSPITEYPNTDYEYRVFVTKDEFSAFLVSHVDTLDYSNFKSRIHSTRGDVFYDACSNVWGAMLEVSDKYPPKKTRTRSY